MEFVEHPVSGPFLIMSLREGIAHLQQGYKRGPDVPFDYDGDFERACGRERTAMRSRAIAATVSQPAFRPSREQPKSEPDANFAPAR